MKRSQVNRAIHEAHELFTRLGFPLPEWASWSPEHWQGVGPEADEIRKHGLGWMVTDFGSGDFEHCGLTIFVVSSGLWVPGGPTVGQPYAEKYFMVLPGQVTPDHFHIEKDETLKVLKGGRLEVELSWPTPDGRSLSSDDVNVTVDSISRKIPAGGLITLEPGQRVHFPRRLAHLFRGRQGDGKVFAGELSTPNDDKTDNIFPGRDVTSKPIVEDEPPAFVLLNEYSPARQLI
jgi:D-lyxose ketol-isomerase